jgi:hypothetical protein
MRAHAGDREGAIEIFQSIVVLLFFVTLVLGLSLSAVIFLLPIHGILHLSSMSVTETRSTLLLLCLNCLVILQWGVITAAYRCAGKYAHIMLTVNILRLLEGISFLILLVWHAGPIQLSMLMLSISIVGTGWMLVMKMKLIPWLPFGVRYARWHCVRELWKPAIAYMASPPAA